MPHGQISLGEAETWHHHRFNANEEIEKKVINAYSFLRELETNLSIKPIEIAEYSEQSAELLTQVKTKELENKKWNNKSIVFIHTGGLQGVESIEEKSGIKLFD